MLPPCRPTPSGAVRVVGASEGLADFLRRRPQQLAALRERPPGPLGAATYRAELAAAVEATDDVEQGRVALRVAYRRHLMLLAAWDLEQDDPLQAQPLVSEGLADLAGAALDAALLLARRASTFPAEDVERTKLAIIGMGKAGARELNYISDVDVIYVADAAEGLETARAVEIATRLAAETRHSGPGARAPAVGGRREPAAGGQGRRARPHARLAPRVLRALGEELGVPGAAQIAPARGRRRARAALLRHGPPHGLVHLSAGRLRGVGAAHARARHGPHPRR